MTRHGGFRLIVALLAGAVVLLSAPVAQTPGPWQNVEILQGASAGDMDLYMQAMNVSLGVGCDHCHEPGRWAAQTPRKEVARAMMRMITTLAGSGFEALDLPTCWTCHQGSALPSEAPRGNGPPFPPGAFHRGSEPSADAYENIQQYSDLPAEELQRVMTVYAVSLGVGCDYCHVEGDWASDEKVAKLLARRMLEIQNETNAARFTSSELSCWTCHRGRSLPAIAIPPDLLGR